jgi:uncharacterized repeat protein (TIGR02543 family)
LNKTAKLTRYDYSTKPARRKQGGTTTVTNTYSYPGRKLLTIFLALALVLALLPATASAEEDVTAIDLSAGDYTISTDGNYSYSGTSTNRIIVNTDVTANITLNNADISSGTGSPLDLQGTATVNLTLEGTNTLSATSGTFAGLHVPAGTPIGATLTITGASTGSLTTQGGTNGAGIGGNENGEGGTITINGGEVTANAGSDGAGIGGGKGGAGGTVTISGGTVTATGGSGGAGIGSGSGDGGGGSLAVSGGILELGSGSTNVTAPSYTDCTVYDNGAANLYDKSGVPSVADILTLTVKLDGGAYTNHGKTFTLRDADSTTKAIGIGMDGTVKFATSSGLDSYNIYDGDTDTGLDMGNGTDTQTANYYTVTLNNLEGATCELFASYLVGLGATLPIPTKDNFGFSGWWSDDGTPDWGTEFDEITDADIGAKTFYARWDNMFNIGFTANGMPYDTMQNIAYGETATEPTPPTKSGYSFAGWFTDDVTFANRFDFATLITQHYDLYAKFTKNPSSNTNGSISPTTATFDKSGGAAVSTALTGGSYTLNRVTFDGAALTKGSEYSVSGNVYTFSADWLETLPEGEHKITFDMSGGTDPVLTLTVTDTTPEPWENPFTDVLEDDWFYEDVEFVATHEPMLFEGTGANTFSPNAAMTRAMLWTVLARLSGETITGVAWARDAQAWALEAGISDGTNSDQFVTRNQIVTMLYRFAGIGEDGYGGEALEWAAGLKIMNDGRPEDTAKRCEVAAILNRFEALAL